MNTIKTVFLAALLSAAAYGVYVGITGSPPNFGPRRKSHDWEETAPDDGPQSALSDMALAPVVSLDAPLPGGPAAAKPFDAPPTAAVMQPVSPPAALRGEAHVGGQMPAGEPPSQRYSSNQPYPSTQSDAASAPPADRFSADRFSPDAAYPSTGVVGGEPQTEDQAPPAQSENIHADFADLMASAQTLLASNHLAEAHLELSEWFGDPRFSPEEDAQLTDLLDRLAGTVIYSRQHLLERPYDVQPGDTLQKIADDYEVPWQLLANINGIRDPNAVRPGDQLKVLKGPFNAYVNLSKFQLVLYLGNRYAGRFRIGLGQDHATPDGEFAVQRKLTNPTYYGQPVIDKDDPRNPLGELAIDLGESMLIHGTNDPQSIGRADSRGSIRLAERDIKDVFDILTPKTERTAGSKVIIRR